MRPKEIIGLRFFWRKVRVNALQKNTTEARVKIRGMEIIYVP